ncbi:response to drug-related protein [Pyrrhoderma noxium]|uniref:Response to drug-related protein n=1 Tax=Pyrrhoderma noxium TaxID=2282107 RepID=A0A286UH55_9AGAM|nr:response to drug-related protein [Pyrrhoderma noxium]
MKKSSPRSRVSVDGVEQEQDQDRTRNNSIESSSASAIPKPSPPSQRHSAVPNNNDGPPQPFSNGFWDKSPGMTRSRKMYLQVLFRGTVLIILVIFGYLSIFWGSLFKTTEYIHKLKGWVVDFDGGSIGQTVVEAFQNNTGLPSQLTWQVIDASQFSNVDEVAAAVVDEQVWVAVTINPGASNNLSAAIANADASYDGSNAITAYAAEARNENGYSIIEPIMQVPLLAAVDAYARQNALQVGTNGSINVQNLLEQAPGVLTTPIYYTINNLRPFDVPVAQAVDFVGLIYLLIISFVTCINNYQARVFISGINRHLRLRSLLLVRIAVPFVSYFVISLFFSLLSLAFQAPFSRFYGKAGFVIYWMMNWCGMMSLGLALESLITVLTPAFTPFFLILWIISNVSVASVPIEVLPGVFRYGYAAPFYNVSLTVRAILFNTKNKIGLNFGVQIAWIAISIVTMSLLTILMRKKEEKAFRQQNNKDIEKA